MGAIDGNSDFFSTAFKFLFCVNYNTSWCTTSLPCFSVLPLFGVLRRTLSELDDLTSLSVTQIYQKNLEEVTQICTSVASNLVQPKLASICVCLFDRLLILSVHQAGLSAEQVAELVLFSVPELVEFCPISVAYFYGGYWANAKINSCPLLALGCTVRSKCINTVVAPVPVPRSAPLS
ncbi:unnamed protein product [Mesocestoides corti]|uniref:Uncharacterized protein n=1 Tax=Mesocestoides corti TaxID=53468 RepID=A0A0R3U9N5_MESCO|nr:unnamed protein product [Mesocestoides corti]